MTDPPLVSVIILSLNGSDVIGDCLDSLGANDYSRFEILVVNNGSTDATATIVGRDYPQVRLINLTRNLGYAGGMNEGLKASRGSIVIPLNDDTICTPSLVREIIEPIRSRSDVGIVGCKILYPDRETLQHAGGEILPDGNTRHFGYHEKDRGQHDEAREVDYVTGCALAVRRSLFEELGLYDDRYFPTYFEEVEFAVRARKAGWRIVYNPRAVLYHLESKTEIVHSRRFFYRYHKSRWRFILKNYTGRQLLGMIVREPKWLMSVSFRQYGISVLRAYLAILIRLPSILYDRKRRKLPLAPVPEADKTKETSALLNHDVQQFRSDKILKHVDRVHAWLEGQNPYPVTMELDMTNVCNHGCPECVVNYFRLGNRDALPRDLAIRIIHELAESKVRALIFTGGGEPLCHQHAPEMIELAAGLGMDVALITNGSLLTEQNMRVILTHCAWVRVSLDAIQPDTYQTMHGLPEHAFKKVIGNIQSLARLKKESESRCTVGVGFLTCESTAGEMVLAAKTAKQWGVDYLQFRPLQIHHGGKFEYDWRPVEEQIQMACEYSGNDYRVLYSKHKYEMIKRKDYGRDYCKCYGQQFASTIAANAKVYVCCHTRDYEKYCLGDLRDQSFQEIWNSERRKEIVDHIDFTDCIPLCRDNTFNQILWRIKQPRVHENFL